MYGNYLNINKYIQYLRTEYELRKQLRFGMMYSYIYLFTEAKDFTKQDYNKVKFYDFYPVTYVFDIDYKKRLFTGLNFHHLPVRSRLIWLKRIDNVLTDNTVYSKIPKGLNLRYEYLKSIFKKSTFGIRRYRMDRVRQMRIIPNNRFEELFRIYSKTYYGVTLKAVENKYKKFRPNF